MSQSPPGAGRAPHALPPAETDVQRLGLRPALSLEELLDHLQVQQLLTAEQARSIESRATTLKSAAFAPIPRDSVASASRVKPGVRRNRRRACLRSWTKSAMEPPLRYEEASVPAWM